MKPVRNILLAVSFEGTSEHDTSSMAGAIGRAFEATVTPIHVVPNLTDRPSAVEVMSQAAARRLDETCRSLVDAGVKVGEPIVALGETLAEILRVADERGADLVVVGSGKEPEGERQRLTTLASHLVRRASQPVLIVKAGCRHRIRKILLPIDLSHPAHLAADFAFGLSRRCEAELTLLTAIRPMLDSYLNEGWGGYIAESHRSLLAEAHDDWRKEQEARFDAIVEDYDLEAIRWRRSLRLGRPPFEIDREAREEAIDLIVMGSAGRTGVSRLLLGSVAEKVIREIPCSVMIVKDRHP